MLADELLHEALAQVNYAPRAQVQGNLVAFVHAPPPGFVGHHEFVLERAAEEGPGAVRLRHVLMMTPADNARLTWPLVWKPLHDALMEDALDRAESAVTGRALPPRPWSWYVRLLRRLVRGRLRRS